MSIDRWRDRELWKHIELVMLCLGLDPSEKDVWSSELLSERAEVERRIDDGVRLGSLKVFRTTREEAPNMIHGTEQRFAPSDAISWAAPKFDKFPFKIQAETANGGRERPLSTNERKALLNIIGAMLELLKSPRNGRDTDAAIIVELVENYGDKYGISKRNLDDKFPEAKRRLAND